MKNHRPLILLIIVLWVALGVVLYIQHRQRQVLQRADGALQNAAGVMEEQRQLIRRQERLIDFQRRVIEKLEERK